MREISTAAPTRASMRAAFWAISRKTPPPTVPHPRSPTEMRPAAIARQHTSRFPMRSSDPMLRGVTDQKEDRGGIMLGGISFGVGAQKSPKVASSGDHIGESEPASAPSVSDSGPVELSDVLLPLRVLVLGSFLPRGDHHGGANAPAAPLRVDGNDVDPLFARLAPRIVIEVASVLLEGGRTKVELTATSLKSFRPDELVEELPLLRSLRDGRRLLERLREGALSAEVTASELTRMWNHSPLVARVLGNVSSVSRGGPTPAVQAAPSHDTAVDRILDLMGGGSDDDDAAGGERDTSAFDGRSGAGSGGASGGGGGGKYGGFLSAVANSGKSGTSVRAEDAIRIVDEALSVQLGAILQHAE
ncbi:MAG: hypothetical protein EXR75_14190, partial [Myxococcales bacterium]|nr:hypothetical protein [Myxococcales bacterium]